MTSVHRITTTTDKPLWIRVVPGVLLVLSGILLIWEWRRDRQSFAGTFAELRSSLEVVGHRLDAQDLERASTLRVLESLRALLDQWEARASRGPGSPEATNIVIEPTSDRRTPAGDAAKDGEVSPDLSALPKIPQGANPRLTIRGIDDVADLLKDEKWNPAGKEIDELTLAEMRVDFAKARGELEVLEAEMYRELTHARAALRERGEYIEYAPGEKYASQPGTVTAAEPRPGGGVRMFYLQPGEFPELYAKRTERDVVAERSLRNFLRRLEDQ